MRRRRRLHAPRLQQQRRRRPLRRQPGRHGLRGGRSPAAEAVLDTQEGEEEGRQQQRPPARHEEEDGTVRGARSSRRSLSPGVRGPAHDGVCLAPTGCTVPSLGGYWPA